MKKLVLILAFALTLGLVGCSGTNQGESTDAPETETQEETEAADTGADTETDAQSEAGANAFAVDETAKTITVPAVATGQAESSIHVLVSKDGGNAGQSFFTTDVTTQDFYDALLKLNAVPGNNISLDAKSGTILGSGLDVKIRIGDQEYGCYDLITASEKRDMDVRFGGNIAVNQELATGCLLCTESCPAGISSDAAYEFCEKVDFLPSDAMPEKGTEVTFVFTVDDTSMVVDEAAGKISMNALSTGYSESTIHAVVSEDGGNADKTLFATPASTKDFYDALKKLGAEDGNNIALDDADGTIEGTTLDVNVEIGTENCSFADLFTASEERKMEMRFGGNIDVNQELATGCVMCLESCPAGITSNAAYQYQEKITFGPSDKMPEKGTHVIVTFTVAK